MDVPGGMPDPTVSASLGFNLEQFLSLDEGRIHLQLPRLFNPPVSSDPKGRDDTIDQSGWSTSDNGGGDGDGDGGGDQGGGGGGYDGGGGGDSEPTVPIIRWTGESQYTHAIQDPNQGGRTSSSGPMVAYTHKSRQRECPWQPVEEEEDRFFDIVPNPDIMPDVEIDSMSTNFEGLSIEGSSGQEQGQWSAHGFGTISAYSSYSGDDDRMMVNAHDYSADASNATS